MLISIAAMIDSIDSNDNLQLRKDAKHSSPPLKNVESRKTRKTSHGSKWHAMAGWPRALSNLSSQGQGAEHSSCRLERFLQLSIALRSSQTKRQADTEDQLIRNKFRQITMYCNSQRVGHRWRWWRWHPSLWERLWPQPSPKGKLAGLTLPHFGQVMSC